MKFLYTSTLVLFISVGFSQNFKTDLESVIPYSATYKGMTRSGVITSGDLLIHERDIVEVVNLRNGETIYRWDPDGGEGQSWISPDGKFVANYSQNAKDAAGRWVNVFQVLNLETKKVYRTFTPDGYWHKAAFGLNESEVLVNTYDEVSGKNTALLYDFVRGKKVKTYFSSTRFSTVIMAMSFSKDGRKVYVGIAENSTNSYINVYDKITGAHIKKIPLTYQMDKFFVSDKYIFVSGASGNTGNPFTSKISSSDYSKIKKWSFRIQNMDASGTYSLMREYKSNVLSKIDLTTGKKTTLLDVSSVGEFEYSSGISVNGTYFFTSIKRKGQMKDQSGTTALLVFKNSY